MSARQGDEPRPRLERQGDYVFGILLIAVAVPDEDRVYYQEIDFVLTKDNGHRSQDARERGSRSTSSGSSAVVSPGDRPGMIAYRLIDEVIEDYLDLVDTMNEEVEELDDHVEDWSPQQIRRRISDLRHDILHIRRTLSPTRDAIRQIVDDRTDVEEGRSLPRRARDRLRQRVRQGPAGERRASTTSATCSAASRDYYVAKVAQDQNEVVKRLTVVASLLLVPTFIVGVYGQNFTYIPEISDWGGWGYLWSWLLIVASTIGQLWYFRRKKWI